jgi:hypothetical protein
MENWVTEGETFKFNAKNNNNNITIVTNPWEGCLRKSNLYLKHRSIILKLVCTNLILVSNRFISFVCYSEQKCERAKKMGDAV